MITRSCASQEQAHLKPRCAHLSLKKFRLVFKTLIALAKMQKYYYYQRACRILILTGLKVAFGK
jgi:hypothetical protein